ncbi:MAG: fibronectin type III domain-containing protein [Chromatiales bacterium]|nr:MAG: fibronectin type III domain-containing protein [Chromatiales bacterium]
MITRFFYSLILLTLINAPSAWSQDTTGLVPFFDSEGTPDSAVPVIDEGAVLLCIGMSQAHWECGGDPDVGQNGWAAQSNLPIVIVDGAISGWEITRIMADPGTYWAAVEQRLRDAGYSNADVQVMWGKNATRTVDNNPDVIAERITLRDGLIQVQQEAEARFPNLRAGFHSSRVYGGHCRANPEPIAHETYLAIVGWDNEAGAIDSSSKWFLGPYIWADGLNMRGDGLTWSVDDFVKEPRTGPGCHPSQSGINKVADENEQFFLKLTYAPPGSGNPPTAPTNLSATAAGETQINLGWTDNSTDETSFRIERALGAGGAFSEIASTGGNVTSFNDMGLAANTEYCYRVRARNGSGDSGYTSQVCATTNAAGGSAPAAPSGLTTTASSDMGVDLSWTDNSNDETNFRVERATGQGGTFTEIATTATNVTTYDSRGLAASTEYCYRVRASNANGNSGYTSMSCATTDASAPNPPPTPPPGPGVQSSGGGVMAAAELGILLLAGLLGLRRRKLER